MPVTIVTGDLGTDTINQSQRVIDIDDKITALEPNAAPLTVLTKKLKKRVAIGPKVEWLESQPMPRFDTLSASAASNATALPVTNGNYFRVGDVLRLEAGDAAEVTATAAGAVTAVRAIGTVTAASAANASEVFIVSNVNSEGACLREIKTPKLDNAYNYTQIVRTPFGITGTEAATKLYGGPDRRRLQAETGIEHMRQWEQIALTGARREDTTTAGKPKRFSGGMVEFCTSNVTSVGGTLTEAAFLTFLRTGFRYGGGRKILLASPLVINAIEGFARTNIQVTNDRASTYGIEMKTYVSGQGTVDLVMERWLQDSVAYRGHAFLVDLDNVFYAPLRDTKLLEDRQPNDCDRIEDEYLTEASFVFAQERTHAIMKGVTG